MKLTASLSAGRSSRPRPPAHPFLMEEKDAKDHSGGVCGLPLKTPGGSLRSQRYIRYAPRVRVSAGWYALTVPGAAQRCGTSFQRLVCGDPPVRKCLRISESVRAFGAHICGAGRSPGEVFSGDQPPPCLLPRTAGKSSLILAVLGDFALLRLASPTVDAHADLRSADRGSLPTGR